MFEEWLHIISYDCFLALITVVVDVDKQVFFQVEQQLLLKKFLNRLRRATALYDLGIVAILLANTRKSLKFYRFESAQNLVSFIDLNFFLFVLG